MLTRNPAKIMGAGHQLGTLEPGKLAAFSVVPEKIQELF